METLGRYIQAESAFLEPLMAATAQVIVGQKGMVERLLVGLLTKGHILLEGFTISANPFVAAGVIIINL